MSPESVIPHSRRNAQPNDRRAGTLEPSGLAARPRPASIRMPGSHVDSFSVATLPCALTPSPLRPHRPARFAARTALQQARPSRHNRDGKRFFRGTERRSRTRCARWHYVQSRTRTARRRSRRHFGALQQRALLSARHFSVDWDSSERASRRPQSPYTLANGFSTAARFTRVEISWSSLVQDARSLNDRGRIQYKQLSVTWMDPSR